MKWALCLLDKLLRPSAKDECTGFGLWAPSEDVVPGNNACLIRKISANRLLTKLYFTTNENDIQNWIPPIKTVCEAERKTKGGELFIPPCHSPIPTNLLFLEQLAGSKDIVCEAIDRGLDGPTTSLHGSNKVLIHYSAGTKHIPGGQSGNRVTWTLAAFGTRKICKLAYLFGWHAFKP